MDQSPLIAIVEDDPEIRALVAELLARDGFRVKPCADARALDEAMEHMTIDLVILDLMLEGEDGLSICRRLQASPVPVPVLMVTAKGDDIDRIIGLEIGADDYLPKPFNPRELVARVRAILRRTTAAPRTLGSGGPEYRFAGWTLDSGSRALRDPDGAAVELTGGEYDLLMAFLNNPQRVLTRDQLLDATRRRSSDPLDRTIDVQLSRLRKRLGESSEDAVLIRTVRGGGYLFTQQVVRIG